MKPFTVAVLRDYHTLWSTFPGRSLGSLLRSAFARRYLRSRCCFPFLQLLRCFSSLRSLYRPYTFRPESPFGGVAPFGDPRITAWLPAPLGLSQVPTSFIASRYQGIHHVPFQAWPCQPDPLPVPCGSCRTSAHAMLDLHVPAFVRAPYDSCANDANVVLEFVLGVCCPTGRRDPGTHARANSLAGSCGRPIRARTRDHRLHLSKSRPLVKVGGSRMIVKPIAPSRGWLDERGEFLYFLL